MPDLPAELPVLIVVRNLGPTMFLAAFPGRTPESEHWAMHKPRWLSLNTKQMTPSLTKSNHKFTLSHRGIDYRYAARIEMSLRESTTTY